MPVLFLEPFQFHFSSFSEIREKLTLHVNSLSFIIN